MSSAFELHIELFCFFALKTIENAGIFPDDLKKTLNENRGRGEIGRGA